MRSFTPFVERVAETRLELIDNELHQDFGRYLGFVISGGSEKVEIKDLVGFAEDHNAWWRFALREGKKREGQRRVSKS